MPRKRQAKAKSVEDTRTPEEIAEERIAAWKRKPAKPSHWSGGDESHTVDVLVSMRTLDLKGLGLKAVPESLREARGIEILDLSENMIQELPPWIGELTALWGISLVRNQLRTLPIEIGSLQRLIFLLLHRNRLETLPDTLRTLPLQSLHLEGNPDLGLPDSILDRPPEEILRYYFESRDGRPLLELKLLLVGRGGAGKTTLVKR